jgi:hypothetical protein
MDSVSPHPKKLLLNEKIKYKVHYEIASVHNLGLNAMIPVHWTPQLPSSKHLQSPEDVWGGEWAVIGQCHNLVASQSEASSRHLHLSGSCKAYQNETSDAVHEWEHTYFVFSIL